MANDKVSDGTDLTGGNASGDLIYIDRGGVDSFVDIDDVGIHGTFTPTIGDGANEYTGVTANGYSVRIGKLALINVTISWTGLGSASGTLYIGNLPFTSNATATYRAAANFSYFSGINTNGDKQLLGHLPQNSTRINLYTANDNAAATGINAQDSSTSGSAQLTILYQIA